MFGKGLGQRRKMRSCDCTLKSMVLDIGAASARKQVQISKFEMQFPLDRRSDLTHIPSFAALADFFLYIQQKENS